MERPEDRTDNSMKFVCIKNSWRGGTYPITIGRVYTAFDATEDFIKIINDINQPDKYTSLWFIELSEYRKKQLDKII